MATIRKTRKHGHGKTAGKNERKIKRPVPHNQKRIKTKQSRKRKVEAEKYFLKSKVTPLNYGSIAFGLHINIGPKAASLVKQLEDKIKPLGIRQSLETARGHIDSLYVCGYDVQDLYAELIATIQFEILNQLPF
jgi:hypothetical protein